VGARLGGSTKSGVDMGILMGESVDIRDGWDTGFRWVLAREPGWVGGNCWERNLDSPSASREKVVHLMYKGHLWVHRKESRLFTKTGQQRKLAVVEE